MRQVYMQEPQYCEWVMTTVAQAEGSEPLKRLAHFIHTNQMRETYAADGWDEIAEMEQEP